MIVKLVEFDQYYLEKSYTWLTDQEIKHSTMAPPVTRESQNNWYNSLSGKSDYYIRGISLDGLPIGAAGIKHIDLSSMVGESWLYIGEKQYQSIGIGTQVMHDLFECARIKGLKALYAKVAQDNEKSIKFHIKLGYKYVDGDPKSNWQSQGIYFLQKTL